MKRRLLFLRQMLARILHTIRGEESAVDLEHLTRLARRFSVEQQQVPKDLNELVAHKYLAAVPPAPARRRFVVDRKTVEVRLESDATPQSLP